MNAKTAKATRRALREMGIDVNFAQYTRDSKGTLSLSGSCGRKLYKEAKRSV